MALKFERKNKMNWVMDDGLTPLHLIKLMTSEVKWNYRKWTTGYKGEEQKLVLRLIFKKSLSRTDGVSQQVRGACCQA